MSHSSPDTSPGAEKSAQKLRHSNQSGNDHASSGAVDAQNKLNRPDQAKGRPAKSGPSNAGRDGGA